MKSAKILMTSAAILAATASWPGRNHHHLKLNETETIERQLDWTEDSEITVYNVYGSVDVVGYDGDVIEITAQNTVFANTEADVKMGLDEIGVKTIQNQLGSFVYLDSPFTHFEDDTGDIWHSDTCVHRHDCSLKYKEKKPYKYHLNMQVRVPKHANITISAINEGDIKIEHVHADKLNVSNVNGAIDMVDVAGQSTVHAINQDINISYAANPASDSSYESINGDLTIQYAQDPDAKVIYQTMNGSMYSTFDYQTLPSEVKVSESKNNTRGNKHGSKYRLSASRPIQLGNGGPTYTFKTLNGDIKIK